MEWRKLTAILLIVLTTSPAWGGVDSVGSVTAANAAVIRGTKLTPGSTVLSGDEISVGEHGVSQIALNAGTQAEILKNSVVRFEKVSGDIKMTVGHGQASFHTTGAKNLEAVVADAMVRPGGEPETSGVIQSLNSGHAIIAATKGSLLITTAHDNKTFTILEGQAADLSAIAAPGSADQQGSGPTPGGKSAPAMSFGSKGAVVWTVVILSAAAVVASYLLIRKENKPSTGTLQNEVSPHTLD